MRIAWAALALVLLPQAMRAQMPAKAAPAKIQEGGDAAMFSAADEADTFARKHKLAYIVGRDVDGGPWSAEFVKGYTVARDPSAPNPIDNKIATGINWEASGYNSLAEAVAAAEKDFKKFHKGHVRVSPDFVPGRVSPDLVAPAPKDNANT